VAAVAVGGAAGPDKISSEPLLSRLMQLATDSYDPDRARRAGGRARFDHLACRTHGLRLAPPELGNAGAAAMGDMDDVHWPSVTHPGTIIWATIDEAGATGDRLWRAAHTGYEVTARLGAALGPDHRRSWHTTATAGTIGAAAAAAVALGSDPTLAAAHAVSVAGGSILCILERTDTRAVHRDHAVATGVHCARLTNLSAALDSLEHPRGMFAAMGGSADGLLAARERTALEEVSFRRHATSGFNQAAVEAAQELAGLDDPTQIELEVPEATAALAAVADPQNSEQAWWSCQHAVAATLLGRDLATCSVDDPAVKRVRGRIRLSVGPVTTLTVDGRVAKRGHAAALTDDDLIAKWRVLNPDTEPPLELIV
jgi:2-methylcitrate dehydratase PrpD